MESDSWNARFSVTSSRRYRSRSGMYLGDHEEIEDDNATAEFLCPFCAEDFDIVGLYCHVDEEHPVEVKNAVCPLCTKRVGMDIVGHVISQHGSLFKVQRHRRLRKSGSNMTFSKLRKELREGSMRSLLGGSLHTTPISTEPDPLLFSFTSNLPVVDKPVRLQPHSSVEVIPMQEGLKAEFSERSCQCSYLSFITTYKAFVFIPSVDCFIHLMAFEVQPPPPLVYYINVQRLPASDKDEKEKAQKCEFVQGLLLSTILDEL